MIEQVKILIRREIQCDICGDQLKSSIDNKKLIHEVLMYKGKAKGVMYCHNCGATILAGEECYAVTINDSDLSWQSELIDLS